MLPLSAKDKAKLVKAAKLLWKAKELVAQVHNENWHTYHEGSLSQLRTDICCATGKALGMTDTELEQII
jgi:hypothetical protein